MDTTNNNLLQQFYVSLSGMSELLISSDEKAKFMANELITANTINDSININSKTVTLPDILTLKQGVPVDPSKITETASQFAQIMMLYDAGIKEIKTKLDILSNEFKVRRNRSPIESVQYRIKEPASILAKMKRRSYPLTLTSMTENISDIAGVRVICPFIQDIYTVAEMLTNQDDIYIIKKKDYISRPKENGYRSLHIVLAVPIYLSSSKQHVRVEVQIRTIAMDFWASLEHQLHYKNTPEVPVGITEDLRRCAQTISETDEKMQEIARKLNTL